MNLFKLMTAARAAMEAREQLKGSVSVVITTAPDGAMVITATIAPETVAWALGMGLAVVEEDHA